MSEVPGSSRRVWLRVIWLGIVLTLAAGVRLWNLSGEGMWIDELFAMEVSAGNGFADQHLPRDELIRPPLPSPTHMDKSKSMIDVWRGMKEDSHPPLYFLLLHAWRDFFGSGDWSVRFFTVLQSLAAIAVFFWIVSSTQSLSVAVWASLLMSFSAPHLVYAREARNNPLMLLAGLLVIAVLLRIERAGVSKGKLIALGGSLLGLMLTNYYGLGAAIAMLIYAMWMLSGTTRWKVFAAFVISGLIYALVWGPMLLQQRDALAKWHPPADPLANPMSLVMKRVGVAPLRQLVGTAYESPAVSLTTAAAIAGIFLLTFNRRDLRIWWMLLIGALGLVFLHDCFSGHSHLFMPKYALLALPAICLLIPAAISQCGKLPMNLRNAMLAAILALCIWHVPQAFAPYRGQARDPGNAIVSRARAGDIVVFCGVLRPDWSAGWNYLRIMHYQNPANWPTPVLLLGKPLAPNDDLMSQLRAARRLFVVIDSPDVPPQNFLPGCKIRGGAYFPFTVAVTEVDFSEE
jgi:4-amino-4-deoxy-L-arabinose transferase-like glycosyltransferase